MSDANGTLDNVQHVNRVKGKVRSAESFFSGLYALRDKTLPEATLVRKMGPDGLNYAVRIPAASELSIDAVADAAKEHGGRVRVSKEGGKSTSWGVSGAKAAETIRTLDGAE